MIDQRLDLIGPERVATSRPVALLRGISRLGEGRQVMELWVGFRGEEDHFAATPKIELTSITPDDENSHLSRFAGTELGQAEHYMAWGEGVEVEGVLNNGRGAVILTEVGGIAINLEEDLSYFLESVPLVHPA